MKYPLLFIKPGKIRVSAMSWGFGIISKGGEDFYKDLTVIDSEGNIMEVQKVEIKGVAKLKYCLMYLQKMLELDVELSHKGKLTLDEMKRMIIERVESNPQKWLSMGAPEYIIDSINQSASIEELIVKFK